MANKYYQKHKEKLQKDINVLLKKKKKETVSIIVNVIKIFLKIKNKS